MLIGFVNVIKKLVQIVEFNPTATLTRCKYNQGFKIAESVFSELTF